MSFVSRLIHFIIFSLSVSAWVIINKVDSTNTFFINLYLRALGATVVIYIASIIFQNVSLYDTYWGGQGALYAITFFQAFNNYSSRSILITSLSLIWSLRLTFLFAIYSWTDIYAEDWRYRMMRNKTNNRLIFSIRSAILHYFLPMNMGFFGHVPLFYILTSNNNNWGFVDAIGVAITGFGVIFEAIADSQLRSTVYKSKNNTSLDSSGTDASICMTSGLWGLCRHPNYFGEFLYWLGLYITGLGELRIRLFKLLLF
jgi:steroid 5-alpha reductase family enzyme